MSSAFAACILSADPAPAADCRLALVLGLDISSSVDRAEDALQRGGVASALLDERVQEAFFASGLPVALAVFEWSGRYNQEVLMDWRLIHDQSDLAVAAETISNSRRSYAEFPTAMGDALRFAAQMLNRSPRCLAQTIDIAGDGESNEGEGPQQVYQDAAFDAITVNGLVVANAADFQTPARLTQFYREEVLHGHGSFMIVAEGFNDYARAMRDKLERELAVTVVGALP
nr:DUF1194 domain-containing protein [Sulfitobacter noctilucicola]